MSQENVEYVRRSQEAWNGGDFGPFLAATPADAEGVIAEENPNARTLRGPEEIAAYLRGWSSTMPGLRYDVAERIDAGDAVVSLGNITGRAGEDGPEITVQLATVTYFDRGGPGADGGVPRSRSRPRSRGPLGVGDVAGERGAAPVGPCSVGARGLQLD
jgi:ketosteroid isomerase-like protein